MRFHWQDLNDADPAGKKRYWWNGRCWWGPWRLEWVLPRGGFRFELAVNEGDDQREWQISIGFPFLFALYLSVRTPWQFPVGHWFEYQGQRTFLNEARHFSVYWHEKALWWTLWADPMGGWSRDSPYWSVTHSLHFDDLVLGKRKHKHVILSDWSDRLIPMPEGCYPARMRLEKRTWTRPRWPWKPFRIEQVYIQIELPGGVPFEGKGENSYDCGEDGLWGCSSSGTSYEKAISHVVESVLESRRRYGFNETNRPTLMAPARPWEEVNE